MSGHTIAQATSTTSANAPPFTNGHTSYESNPPPTSSSDPLTANHSLFPFSYSPQVPAVGFPSTKATDDPSRPIPPLFTPLTLRSLTLKNRIGVAPMCQYSCSDGFLSAYHLVHLGQFALGGAALIIQEATAVQPNGRISPHDAGLWKDEHIPPIQRIVDFIHSQQAAAGIQLAHAGRKASTPSPFLDERGKVLRVEKEDGGWPDDVVGPSPIPWAEGWIVPRALTLEEIDQFKRDWVAAVRRAIRCGFDFLEVHAAHGYTVHTDTCC